MKAFQSFENHRRLGAPIRRLATAGFASALILCACGLESLLGLSTAENHPTPDAGTPVTPQSAVVTGLVPSASVADLVAADLVFVSGSGEVVVPTVTIENENFTAIFPAGERYTGMLVLVQRKTTALRALVAQALPGESSNAGDFDGIDNRETAAAILIEAKASQAGRTLGSFPGETLQQALADITGADQGNELKKFFGMVLAITACTDCNRGSAVRFRSARMGEKGQVLQSPLHPDFIFANPMDYDGDGQPENSTDKFDAALSQSLEKFTFKACYCDEAEFLATTECCQQNDPAISIACGASPFRPVIRVVFAADFNSGKKDGNCDTIDRFRSAVDKNGASMFFSGKFHEDSPIQDQAIADELGNWRPNVLPMYDDGTHGDETPGDGIWTISFVLPVGLKIGYKYTWGLQNEQWGGSEEWPGNRRILEVADVNGDHLVARYDNFGDETSNKDKANTLLPSNGGKGTVTWDTDANKDSIPDARERMTDADNDCTLDRWWTPASLPPMTTACP